LVPSRRSDEGSGTGESPVVTTPVFPFPPRPLRLLLKISAANANPELFAAKSPIVALATWNRIAVLKASGAPLPQVGQLMPNAKFPAPSMWKGPAAAANV